MVTMLPFLVTFMANYKLRWLQWIKTKEFKLLIQKQGK